MVDKRTRAEHYRNKAEEVRALAESMNNAEAKAFMTGVAADYIMLARIIEHIADPIPASE